MKTKGLLFGLIAIVASFTMGSCKKDNGTPANSFTYASQSYQTPYAAGSGEASAGAEYTDLTFLSVDPSKILTSGKISMGFIEFASYPLTAGTYTFKAFGSDGFDKKKNFSSADFGINMDIKNGTPDDTSGTQLIEDDLTGGTITVAKSGDVYTITYNLTYKSGTISGQYNGKISGL
ncbi:hypothetical protein [Pinibacter soli]|uniref:CHRD domain-containing protein n=1 Tax=Pinibacter soli TaxID=3044211 RepID=A0ABT6RJQ8_9BACT|nr:hypothetical protein [Pinibacter soli]MDI3322650.1 hypothetical protein [Pinibacter soli]